MSDYFKARCKQNEDGSYTLSYGKGKNKRTAELAKTSGDHWSITSLRPAPFARKRDAVSAWETWAASAYEGSTRKQPVTPTQASAVLLSADADFALTEWERGFFLNLTEQKGQLTEWQRSQMIATLRTLTNTPAAPQLAFVMSKSTPGAIQKMITDASSREDQIRRWFQAFITTGQEFKLPETVRSGPPAFNGGLKHGVSSGPPAFKPPQVPQTRGPEPVEAPTADSDQSGDGEETAVSGGTQPDAAV